MILESIVFCALSRNCWWSSNGLMVIKWKLILSLCGYRWSERKESIYKEKSIYWHILYMTIVSNWQVKLLWRKIHMQYTHTVCIHLHLHTYSYRSFKSLWLWGQHFRITGRENFLLPESDFHVMILWADDLGYTD